MTRFRRWPGATSPSGSTRRLRLAKVGSLVFSLCGVALFAADYLGLKPLPSAEAVRRRVSRAWSKVGGYHAGVAVGMDERNRKLLSGTQVYLRDGSVGFVEGSMGGFNSRGQLRETHWNVEYPEAELVVSYDIRDLERTPYGRWYVMGAPTLPEVIQVIETAEEVRPRDWGYSTTFRYLTVDVVPRRPEAPRGETSQHLQEFYEKYLTDPWQVNIDRETDLPVEVRIGPERKWHAGIKFSDLVLSPRQQSVELERDTLPRPKPATQRFNCTLLGRPSYDEARRNVTQRVSKIRTQLMRGRPPGRTRPGKTPNGA